MSCWSERTRRSCAGPACSTTRLYGEGWVVRARPARTEDPVRLLESASAIVQRLQERIRALHIRCWPATPDLEMYEIGIECSAILTKLNEEIAARPAGEAILLVTDDPTSPIEMVRWSDQTGHPVLAHRKERTLHHFLVRKEAEPKPRRRPGSAGGSRRLTSRSGSGSGFPTRSRNRRSCGRRGTRAGTSERTRCGSSARRSGSR